MDLLVTIPILHSIPKWGKGRREWRDEGTDERKWAQSSIWGLPPTVKLRTVNSSISQLSFSVLVSSSRLSFASFICSSATAHLLIYFLLWNHEEQTLMRPLPLLSHTSPSNPKEAPWFTINPSRSSCVKRSATETAQLWKKNIVPNPKI